MQNNKTFEKEVFTVFSQKHNILGYFVKIGEGDNEIVVDTTDGEFTYKGFNEYLEAEWEFIGLL
jgi:hypothetical protein